MENQKRLYYSFGTDTSKYNDYYDEEWSEKIIDILSYMNYRIPPIEENHEKIILTGNLNQYRGYSSPNIDLEEVGITFIELLRYYDYNTAIEELLEIYNAYPIYKNDPNVKNRYCISKICEAELIKDNSKKRLLAK